MNRLLPWAILALAAAFAWLVLPKILDRPPGPPGPAAPVPSLNPPALPKEPLDFRVYRSRDEVVVFARTTEFVVVSMMERR